MCYIISYFQLNANKERMVRRQSQSADMKKMARAAEDKRSRSIVSMPRKTNQPVIMVSL